MIKYRIVWKSEIGKVEMSIAHGNSPGDCIARFLEFTPGVHNIIRITKFNPIAA